MQLYLLHEATLDDIKNRIPIFIKKYFKNDNSEETLELVRQLAELDPTRGKYTEWIIKNYLDGKIIIPEDNDKITELLEQFHKKKNNLEDKDIFHYTPGELAKTLDDIISKRQLKMGRLDDLPKGAKHIKSDGKYDVVKITDPDASAILCDGTQWCTKDAKVANEEYLKYGPLYLVYKDGERYALAHFESGQIMDIYDESIIGKEKFDLLDIVGFDYSKDPGWTYEYAVEVLGGERWPEGEQIIKTDPEWSYNYARNVIKGRWPEAEEIIKTDPNSAHQYAKYVIKGRWLEGEKAIKTSPWLAYSYASDVIKGRWPEGEEAIKTDYKYAYLYARNVINDRWPKGEEAIKTDPEYAYGYAHGIIGDRWPKGEEAIKTKPQWAYYYAKNVIKDRWLEAEEAIKTDPEWAYYYAKNVIKDRWSEGEEAIKKDPGWWKKYKNLS